MNRKELAVVLGVSTTAIGHWEKEGMPVVVKAGRGSPNDYNLDDCLAWIKKNGKGRSVRVDRPGAATRINALTRNTGTNSDRDGYLMLTENELEDAIIFGETQGKIHALEWVAENFLVIAASLIRFGKLDPETAVNLGFHAAYSLQTLGCTAHKIERLKPDPKSRVARWLKTDKETLAEFTAMAVEMQNLWANKQGVQ